MPRHVQEAIVAHPNIHEGAEGHHILHHTWEEIHGLSDRVHIYVKQTLEVIIKYP